MIYDVLCKESKIHFFYQLAYIVYSMCVDDSIHLVLARWPVRYKRLKLTCPFAHLRLTCLTFILVIHNWKMEHFLCDWERTLRSVPGRHELLWPLLDWLFLLYCVYLYQSFAWAYPVESPEFSQLSVIAITMYIITHLKQIYACLCIIVYTQNIQTCAK